MAWTKRQIIEQAFEEAGLASFVFDLSADQIMSAVRRLDSLMAVWNAKGISFPYPISDSANGSDPDQNSGLPDYAVQAAYLALAIQIAPSYGKAIAADTKLSAKQAYDAIAALAAMPQEMQISGLPSGAGAKTIDYPFLREPDTSGVRNSNGDTLIFGG